MPKRTNKTNHVLNLLVSGNQAGPDDSSSEALPSDSQPAKGTQTAGPQTPVPQSAAPLASGTQAGIRIVDSSQNANHSIANAIKASLEQEAAQMGISPRAAAAAPQQAETAPSQQAEADGDVKTEVKPEPETDYQFVNVMELVVKESLLDYMERFDLCTCPRCQADVTALALTCLPSKYIVAPKESVTPLLSFFSSKYKVPVMTELTKSCLQVLANPRH